MIVRLKGDTTHGTMCAQQLVALTIMDGEVGIMETRRRSPFVGDVFSIQSEISDQLDKIENAATSNAEISMEIGKLRELHQVLVYKIEILRRINNGEL